jgi:hypothetical protein
LLLGSSGSHKEKRLLPDKSLNDWLQRRCNVSSDDVTELLNISINPVETSKGNVGG